tara:strand:- start:791759 stop:791932 length:174 start_codon:yes stop_codon:yes gene_type:complete
VVVCLDLRHAGNPMNRIGQRRRRISRRFDRCDGRGTNKPVLVAKESVPQQEHASVFP